MTIEAFADHIGTSRQTIHAIIAGRSAVREEMAVRLARAFKTTPQFWLNMQANHVVWEIERLRDIHRIRPLGGGVEGVKRDRRTGAVATGVRKRVTSDRSTPPSRSKGRH